MGDRERDSERVREGGKHRNRGREGTERNRVRAREVGDRDREIEREGRS